MKITEPKTPYVRYNAETDEIEGGWYSFCSTNEALDNSVDIPTLDLNGHYISPGSPMMPPSPTGADTSGPSSRRTSISSSGRGPSSSGRSGSGNSSRSTSFNLPDEARKGIRADHSGRDTGEEVEFEEEEMDEEGLRISFYISIILSHLITAAKKHAAFIRARGRHYSQEAEAMKVC